MKSRVVVAMSGGVDSSVAAALLVEQGFEVIGVTLELWGKDVCVSSGTRLCCSVRDTMDAKAVAKRLGIRHEVLKLEQTFRTHVIDYFVESYREGLTPNPCIACNHDIKFGALLDWAAAHDAEAVATGHYARLTYDRFTGRWILERAVDHTKDQSYVLFTLSQTQLSHTRLPLGGLNKARVREMAQQLGLVTADKPESQDVCFVRDRNKDGFLRRELGVEDEPGLIVDVEGRELGTHRGLLGYTIGQREGLGIALGRPFYVVALDRTNNRLVVGSREHILALSLTAEHVNWVSISAPQYPRRALVKIRSRHEAAPASLIPETPDRVRVEFHEPQSAITPGQAAVFYDGEAVLGGGWIAGSNQQLATSDQRPAICNT